MIRVERALARFTHELVTGLRDEPVRIVAARMRERGVGCVIIVEEGRPVGVVTDRDLTLRVLAEGRSSETPVGSVMTSTPLTLQSDAELDAAVRMMRASGVRRLPIVDGRGSLVGIVTADDLLVTLARELSQLGEGIEGNVDAPELR